MESNMESREGINSGVTMIAHEAPSTYHMVPRIENSTVVSVTPEVIPNPVSAGSAGTTEKKKRGRPRKYGADGTNATAISAIPLSASAPPTTGYYLADKASGGQPYTSEKKYKPKVDSIGEWVACSTGGNFLPHMITINAGEDVSVKIVSFCQQGPRAVCIISAAGLISNVTLRQPNSSGGTLTYEGRFEILSLSGSFTPAELGGTQFCRTGGMSILLVSPDGRVIGGTLAGLLTAASPVEVVVGSFLPSNHHELKPKKHKYQFKAISEAATTNHAPNAAASADHPNFKPQAVNSSTAETPGVLPSSTFQTGNWGGNSAMEDSRNASTDMKISLQGQ